MQKLSSSQLVLRIYLVLMLAFLLLPLMVSGGAAFNDSKFPSVWPWRGFTDRWFIDLWNNERFWLALANTGIIAFAVMVIAVPIGTAAAIILNSVQGKSRSFLYALMTAPILTPGAVIGISTLIFWRNFEVPAGLTITALGQVSVIAAYVMLLVLARLQSFDRALEEAALDLGASHLQVFGAILLPHLKPAIFLGAVISFLQSTEGYNIPLFTRGGNETVMTYIASQARTGVTPMVNAVALLIMAVTVIAGIAYEVLRRREAHIRDKLDYLAHNATRNEELSLAT